MLDDWWATIDAIALDRVSGASEIALNCAIAMNDYLQGEPPGGLEEIRSTIYAVTERILSGQPTMASVLRLLNDIVTTVDEKVANSSTLVEVIRLLCATYRERLTHAANIISQQADRLILSGATITTISSSRAVYAALAAAASHRKEVEVICLESRPACEGRVLARQLAELGIKVRLVVDAGVYDAISEADLWLSGADSLTQQGVVNKLGTAAMALLGKARAVPGYILADTSKIWPAAIPDPPIASHDPLEVWEGAPQNVNITNRYFDVTPWDAIAGVVTEDGILAAQAVTDMCSSIHVHPLINRIVRSNC